MLGTIGEVRSFLAVQHQQLQHMIALLEEEARSSGYDYSADFLRIAARSLQTEIALSEEIALTGETSLESCAILQ